MIRWKFVSCLTLAMQNILESGAIM